MDDKIPSPTRSNLPVSRGKGVLIRTAIIYLAVGAIVAQATLLLVRNAGLPPAVFQAVVSILLLGLPLILIGVSGLEERFGEQAAIERLARSPWTSAPMALLLGALALAVGVSGWVVLPGTFSMVGLGTANPTATPSTLIGVLPPHVDSDRTVDQTDAARRRTSLSSRISTLPALTLLPDSLAELYRAAPPVAEGADGGTPSVLLIQETVIRDANGVQIRAQVVNHRTGDVVWEGGVNDPFRTVAELSDSLLTFLMGTTGPAG